MRRTQMTAHPWAHRPEEKRRVRRQLQELERLRWDLETRR